MRRFISRRQSVTAVIVAVVLTWVAVPDAAALETAIETQGVDNIYQLVDSNDPGGPTAELDNSCTGTDVPLFPIGPLDDEEVTVTLPWSVGFYSNSYSQIRVGINGGFSFHLAEQIWAGNGDLGTHGNADHPAVYPFWDDLLFEAANISTSNVFTCTEGAAGERSFEIIWRKVDCFDLCGPGLDASFKIKLFEDRPDIEFHYADVTFGPTTLANKARLATIGIDSGKASLGQTAYLQYSLNQQTVEANHAIRFYIPSCGSSDPTQVATRAGSTLSGTEGADVLIGHLGPDTIFGYAGADVLCGNAGDDHLRGGPAADLMFGGDGADRLYGSGGADKIYGGGGNDEIFGQGGTDELHGDAGADEIHGQGAADDINGDAGNDVLRGQMGADVMRGGAGNDEAFGNIGPDTIQGGTGDDRLIGGEGNDILTGDAGIDRCAGNTGPADQAHAASCEATPGIEIFF